MAANRVGRRVNKVCGSQSQSRAPGLSLQRRQARVTVKYNRRELQRRLDTEKWIDCGLDQLYQGRVSTAIVLLLINTTEQISGTRAKWVLQYYQILLLYNTSAEYIVII